MGNNFNNRFVWTTRNRLAAVRKTIKFLRGCLAILGLDDNYRRSEGQISAGLNLIPFCLNVPWTRIDGLACCRRASS